MRWFKHMTDASDGQFLQHLEADMGLEAYARWFKLLEIVGTKMDKSSTCSASYSWTEWQAKLKGKQKKLRTFLERLENDRKIILNETGNILEIKIPKLLEIRDEYSKKSGHTPDTYQDSVQTQDIDTDIDTEEETTTPRETPKRVNVEWDQSVEVAELWERHVDGVDVNVKQVRKWVGAFGFELVYQTIQRLALSGKLSEVGHPYIVKVLQSEAEKRKPEPEPEPFMSPEMKMILGIK